MQLAREGICTWVFCHSPGPSEEPIALRLIHSIAHGGSLAGWLPFLKSFGILWQPAQMVIHFQNRKAHEAIDDCTRHSVFKKRVFHDLHLIVASLLHGCMFTLENDGDYLRCISHSMDKSGLRQISLFESQCSTSRA